MLPPGNMSEKRWLWCVKHSYHDWSKHLSMGRPDLKRSAYDRHAVATQYTLRIHCLENFKCLRAWCSSDRRVTR